MIFEHRRKIYSITASFLIASLSSILLFFFSKIMGIICFLFLWFFLERLLLPVIGRLIGKDQRYDPAFRIGTNVRICRFPYDFELNEALEEKFGEFEFSIFGEGTLVENDGIMVCVETQDEYLLSHINCLEILPDNYVCGKFDEPEDPAITYETID